ncbi:MAG TPA: helix-hairpin-helix domain-containing protein [Anaerolineaceae bacterium]|nr:helix-hairpin-helix domain-containing protein [Anaerolineaceae bacterium]
MKTWQVLVVGVLIGVIAAALILLVTAPPLGKANQLIPPPTANVIIVHVAGAVTRPGVYPMSPGSRMDDAIKAAGGLRANADEALLNLAEPVHDGMKVVVYAQGEKASPSQAPDPLAGVSSGESTPALVTYPVDINHASQAELENLPGIGATRAQDIINYRNQNGLFATIEAIQNVKGIGPGLFAEIKDLITVEPNP